MDESAYLRVDVIDDFLWIFLFLHFLDIVPKVFDCVLKAQTDCGEGREGQN